MFLNCRNEIGLSKKNTWRRLNTWPGLETYLHCHLKPEQLLATFDLCVARAAGERIVQHQSIYSKRENNLQKKRKQSSEKCIADAYTDADADAEQMNI